MCGITSIWQFSRIWKENKWFHMFSINSYFFGTKIMISTMIITSSMIAWGKSLLELCGTTFLPDRQSPLIFGWFTSKSHGGCQSGRKVVPQDSKSDLPLSTWNYELTRCTILLLILFLWAKWRNKRQRINPRLSSSFFSFVIFDGIWQRKWKKDHTILSTRTTVHCTVLVLSHFDSNFF